MGWLLGCRGGCFLAGYRVVPQEQGGPSLGFGSIGLTVLMNRASITRFHQVLSFIPTFRDYSDAAAVPQAAGASGGLRRTIAWPNRFAHGLWVGVTARADDVGLSPVMVRLHFLEAVARITRGVRSGNRISAARGGSEGPLPALHSGTVAGAPTRPKTPSPQVDSLGLFVTASSGGPSAAVTALAAYLGRKVAEFGRAVPNKYGLARVGFGGLRVTSFRLPHRLC